MNAAPVLGLAALGALALMLASGSSASAAVPGSSSSVPKPLPGPVPRPRKPAKPAGNPGIVPPKTQSGTPPPDVLKMMADALATNDPSKMRAVALKLDAMGWPGLADEMRRAADVAMVAPQILPAGVVLPPSIMVPSLRPPITVPGVALPPVLAPAHTAPAGVSLPSGGVVRSAAVPALYTRVLKLLSPNMRGADVLAWQTKLQQLGYPPGKLDSLFGPKVETATRAFQVARRIAVDGQVWNETLNAAYGLGAPALPQRSSPLPGIVPNMVPSEQVSALQQAAVAMVNTLIAHPVKGQEDQATVKRYQSMVKGLNPTGLYGPGTAKSLIQLRTGLVPPKPRYWPSSGTAASKADYKQNLLHQASLDPQRAEEWRQAAVV